MEQRERELAPQKRQDAGDEILEWAGVTSSGLVSELWGLVPDSAGFGAGLTRIRYVISEGKCRYSGGCFYLRAKEQQACAPHTRHQPRAFVLGYSFGFEGPAGIPRACPGSEAHTLEDVATDHVRQRGLLFCDTASGLRCNKVIISGHGPCLWGDAVLGLCQGWGPIIWRTSSKSSINVMRGEPGRARGTDPVRKGKIFAG